MTWLTKTLLAADGTVIYDVTEEVHQTPAEALDQMVQHRVSQGGLLLHQTSSSARIQRRTLVNHGCQQAVETIAVHEVDPRPAWQIFGHNCDGCGQTVTRCVCAFAQEETLW